MHKGGGRCSISWEDQLLPSLTGQPKGAREPFSRASWPKNHWLSPQKRPTCFLWLLRVNRCASGRAQQIRGSTVRGTPPRVGSQGVQRGTGTCSLSPKVKPEPRKRLQCPLHQCNLACAGCAQVLCQVKHGPSSVAPKPSSHASTPSPAHHHQKSHAVYNICHQLYAMK